MAVKSNDKIKVMVITLLVLIIAGIGLIAVAPKLSIWSRSFTNEFDHYEYLEPGQSISMSFGAPFDRLNSVKLDVERLGERNVVASTQAELVLSDASGNVICSKPVSSVLEAEFSFGGLQLDRDVLYELTYELDGISGETDKIGIGVTSSGDLSFSMQGAYNGAPTKGTFIVCYIMIAALVLAYVWFCGEQDVKKTGLIDKAILAVGIFMAILFVNQFYDLFMVGKSGLRMLDAIKDGKFFGFYDYAYSKELSNGSPGMYFEYFYSIVTYLIIAVLMLPFRLFADGNIGFSATANLLVLYFDVIIAALVVWSVKLTEKICDACQMPEKYRTSVKYIYAFSSVLISSLIASGQIDIIYLIIMLWALPFYYSGKYKMFSLVMAFSVAVKVLPFMVFFPMILLVNKKIKDIAVNTAICFSVTLVFTLIFNHGTGYEAIGGMIHDKYGFVDKLFDNRLGISMSLFILGYVVICILCYLKDIDASDKKNLLYSSMLIIFAVYGLFTAFIDWHTQWLIPLFLSFAFLVPFVQKKNRVLIVECVLEALIILVSDSVCGTAYMIDNGLLALPEYEYQGISITEAMENITPFAPEMLITLQAAAVIGLIVYFAKENPFRKERSQMQASDYAVDRSFAVGRIFVLYALMLISLWQYSYVG